MLKIGLMIYFIMLAGGIVGQANRKEVLPNLTRADIIRLFASEENGNPLDSNSTDSQNSNMTSSGSWEDDDDSARELITQFYFVVPKMRDTIPFLTSAYFTIARDITTPPPRA